MADTTMIHRMTPHDTAAIPVAICGVPGGQQTNTASAVTCPECRATDFAANIYLSFQPNNNRDTADAELLAARAIVQAYEMARRKYTWAGR